jgi:hypothetical protein
VSNSASSPSTANGANVQDTFPADITTHNWTSTASGGATGNTASGTGDINDTLVLPPGSSVTYTVNATIGCPPTNPTIDNTATVTAPGGFTDTNPGNNSATDSDFTSC